MKSVLVTGVCGGIGHALARMLVDQGWDVYGNDIIDVPKDLHLTEFWKGDVAEEEFWRSVVVPGLKDKKGLDGFVHNAAIQPCSSIIDTSLKDWNDTLAVNLSAAFLGTRYLFPFLQNRNAAIVNVSSVHALETSGGLSAYVASKGGLLAFTRVAALELADSKIRVNAVLPGAVDTQMLEKGLKRSIHGADKAKEDLISRTPLKRVANADEIARAVIFLLDENQSSFLTGQSLIVDGGALARLSTEQI